MQREKAIRLVFKKMASEMEKETCLTRGRREKDSTEKYRPIREERTLHFLPKR